MKSLIKNEKGSITLFVLISMLFFTMFLMTIYTLSTNNEIAGREATKRIKEIYEVGLDRIDDIYNRVKIKALTQIEVETITINGGGNTTIGVNETMTLTAEISPQTATNKEIKWNSSDNTIATVDENGVVTGVAEGTVIITATATNGVSTTYEITVKEVKISMQVQNNGNCPVVNNLTDNPNEYIITAKPKNGR